MTEEPISKERDRCRSAKFLAPTVVAVSMNVLACGPGRLTTGATSTTPEPPRDGASGTRDDDELLRVGDWAQLPGEDHPIVGTFRYRDVRCTETYSYRSDGTHTSTSGESRSKAASVSRPRPYRTASTAT